MREATAFSLYPRMQSMQVCAILVCPFALADNKIVYNTHNPSSIRSTLHALLRNPVHTVTKIHPTTQKNQTGDSAPPLSSSAPFALPLPLPFDSAGFTSSFNAGSDDVGVACGCSCAAPEDGGEAALPGSVLFILGVYWSVGRFWVSGIEWQRGHSTRVNSHASTQHHALTHRRSGWQRARLGPREGKGGPRRRGS